MKTPTVQLMIYIIQNDPKIFSKLLNTQFYI